MTEENNKESTPKTPETQIDAQAGSAVQKRLVLTILIVILMAMTAVASVYRQEIYVSIFRTFSNLTASKPDPKIKSEIAPQVQKVEPGQSENTTTPKMETHEPGRSSIDQAQVQVLSLASEVEKSVPETVKSEDQKNDGLNFSSVASAPSTEQSAGSQTSKPLNSVNSSEKNKSQQETQKGPKAAKPETKNSQKETTKEDLQPTKNENSEPKNSGSSEQFLVPGSLTVNIENYAGSLTKWRLMTILDDSDLMAKDAKPWNPNRFSTAVNFVSRLSSQLTPGSKLAVRDFACVKKDDRAKAVPCLSRMLSDWSDAPHSGLKDKLQEAKPGGSVNPCAAAAYSMKKDFLVSDSLRPRLLLITAGAARCNAKDVLKAAGAIGPGAKTPVDILAVGMSKKKKSAYANLAKKTGGVFLQVDTPADIENALKKYSKSMQVTAVDRIEVRGDKVVFSVNSNEDITLAPGTYTVVLPSIKGLAEFKRSVPNVRIKSGEATLMTVKISKGKASVKIGAK